MLINIIFLGVNLSSFNFTKRRVFNYYISEIANMKNDKNTAYLIDFNDFIL